MDWERIFEPVEGLDTYWGSNLTRYQYWYYLCRPHLQSRVSLKTKLGRSLYLFYTSIHVRTAEPELTDLFPKISCQGLEKLIVTEKGVLFPALCIPNLIEAVDFEREVEQLIESEDDSVEIIAKSIYRSFRLNHLKLKMCKLALDWLK